MTGKTFILGIVAFFSIYLMLSLPLVAATDVNIIFNGVTQETVQYDQESLVNKQIIISHTPSDTGWTNVRVQASITSASLAHSIKKIYLYKCGKMSPTECVQTQPQVFDSWVDTELAWKDISEKDGTANYPQTANIMFLVKVENMNQKVDWVGFWTEIKRSNYNIFNSYSRQLARIDLYASSLDYVSHIKAFIENKMMIPFNWVSKAVFFDATYVHALGASTDEIERQTFSTAQSSSNEFTQINKDFYFVVPTTSSGISSPITLNLNPEFTCGNTVCESDLGENMETCCYDCGCEKGEYCDASKIDPSGGSCRTDAISIESVTSSSGTVTDCTGELTSNITVRISNPPSNLPSTIDAIIRINNYPYPSKCIGGPSIYDCSLRIRPGIMCGSGAYNLGKAQMNMTISYNNGPNNVRKEIGTEFSNVFINYDCTCQEGMYCDSGTNRCQADNAISLGIINLTSYLNNYSPGNSVYLTAKIFNPPTGLTLMSASAEMNLTAGSVYPGTPTCSKPNSNYEYNCSIPFQIADYSDQSAYTFMPNKLIFTITYNDAAVARTKTLETMFGPVSIPSQYCGDSSCNMGEDQETCCYDCGCPSTNMYCDKVSGCNSQSDVGATVTSTYPSEFTDCSEDHVAELSVTINGNPYNVHASQFKYLKDGAEVGWNMQCTQPDNGLMDCKLSVPKLENCSLPSFDMTNNSLQMLLTYPDGNKPVPITKTVNTPFSDISVVPTYHCGDGNCESDFLEGPDNCCIDCACNTTEQYCDYHQTYYQNGRCMEKNDITLVIDGPTDPVTFDSCEVTNEVNVVAHINNQPFSATIENYYVSLGDKTAAISCTKKSNLQGSTDYLGLTDEMINLTNQSYADVKEVITQSLNCSLKIARERACSRGQTYSYGPNNMTVIITYKDGKNIPVIKALHAELPEISTTQTIKSMYDIMEEASTKMKGVLDEMLSLSDAMIDAIDSCIKQMTMMMYLSMALTIGGFAAGMIWGDSVKGTAAKAATTTGTAATTTAGATGSGAFTNNELNIAYRNEIMTDRDEQVIAQWKKQNPGKNFWDDYKASDDYSDYSSTSTAAKNANPTKASNWNLKSAVKNGKEWMTAGASVGKMLMSGIQARCQLTMQMYQMQIAKLKLQMKRIEMETCISTQQHMMDAGLCDNVEQSCFNQMSSCISGGISALTDLSSTASTVTNNVANIANQFSNSLLQAANMVDKILGGTTGDASFQLKWGVSNRFDSSSTTVCNSDNINKYAVQNTLGAAPRYSTCASGTIGYYSNNYCCPVGSTGIKIVGSTATCMKGNSENNFATVQTPISAANQPAVCSNTQMKFLATIKAGTCSGGLKVNIARSGVTTPYVVGANAIIQTNDLITRLVPGYNSMIGQTVGGFTATLFCDQAGGKTNVMDSGEQVSSSVMSFNIMILDRTNTATGCPSCGSLVGSGSGVGTACTGSTNMQGTCAYGLLCKTTYPQTQGICQAASTFGASTYSGTPNPTGGGTGAAAGKSGGSGSPPPTQTDSTKIDKSTNKLEIGGICTEPQQCKGWDQSTWAVTCITGDRFAPYSICGYCIKEGQSCYRNEDCCGSMFCDHDKCSYSINGETTTASTQPPGGETNPTPSVVISTTCKSRGETCTTTDQCCLKNSGDECQGTCCVKDGYNCEYDNDCCNGVCTKEIGSVYGKCQYTPGI